MADISKLFGRRWQASYEAASRATQSQIGHSIDAFYLGEETSALYVWGRRKQSFYVVSSFVAGITMSFPC